jgi:hypothetical protein
MDKDYFYQKRAEERQREISQELATRNRMKEAKHEPLTPKQARGLVFRLAPVVIVLTILLLVSLLL